MAAEPVKSQPLHNFPLAHLKWGHRSHHTSTNHRFSRRDSPTVSRPSPPSGSDGDAELEPRPKVPPPGSPPNFPFSLCSAPKQQQQPPHDEEEGETKAWNLRPRKATGAPAARSGEMPENFANSAPKSQRLRGVSDGNRVTERKEKKRKIWISLSREEIEEDVYALTGSRPARRPKKRPKPVQKLVDNAFPGLYLVGLTVDSYRVHESLR